MRSGTAKGSPAAILCGEGGGIPPGKGAVTSRDPPEGREGNGGGMVEIEGKMVEIEGKMVEIEGKMGVKGGERQLRAESEKGGGGKAKKCTKITQIWPKNGV